MLSTIKKKNRALAPGLVWLQLIPFLGLIWQFIVVYKTSISIRNQFLSPVENSSGLGLEKIVALSEKTPFPTLTIGIAYCILSTSGMVLQISNILTESLVPVQLTLILGGLTCWIIYWVKIARFKQFFRNQNSAE
jgi:hypothetical protein